MRSAVHQDYSLVNCPNRPGELPFPILSEDMQGHMPRPSRRPDTRRTSPQPGWPERLLASPVYHTQKQLVRRHLPDNALVLQCLMALAQQGGVMTPIALAQHLRISAVHFDDFLAKLQHLLNMDGYTVLQIDRERNFVALHVPLLQRQFALD